MTDLLISYIRESWPPFAVGLALGLILGVGAGVLL